MFRKHTRRAAKAAFAISFGVALLIGLTACGGGGGGNDNDDDFCVRAEADDHCSARRTSARSYILGQLYGQALKAKGFHVTFKGNFGESELANKAIKSGKIDIYPEYTGVIVLDLAKAKFPKTAEATYAAAKKYEETQGLTLLNPTPFEDVDTFTMLTSTAHKDGLKTMSDLKKVKSVHVRRVSRRARRGSPACSG